MMDRQQYIWLFWVGSFFFPWITLFIGNRRVRRPMLIVAAIVFPTGVFQHFHLLDYWHPPTLFNLGKKLGFDLESFFYASLASSLASGLYLTLSESPSIKRGTPLPWKLILAFFSSAIISFFISLVIFKLNSIYAAHLGMSAGIIYCFFVRQIKILPLAVSGLLFLGFYCFIFKFVDLASGGYIQKFWNLDRLWGLQVGGIPLEEMLYGGLGGIFYGCFGELLISSSASTPIVKN